MNNAETPSTGYPAATVLLPEVTRHASNKGTQHPMRELVFGAMPHGATEVTHIAAGPWCFTGQEHFFPGWDDGAFTLMPDPFSPVAQIAPSNDTTPPMAENTNAMPRPGIDAIARAANGEALRLITTLGQEMNTHFRVAYSSRFWEMALGPWLLLIVHMLAERQQRMADLIARYGHEPLRIAIIPENTHFSFDTSLEYMLHGVLNRDFNHYVFSRMLESMAPVCWVLEPVHNQQLFIAPPTGPGNENRHAKKNKKGPQKTPACPPQRAFGIAGTITHLTRQLAALLPHYRRTIQSTIKKGLLALPFPRQKGFSMYHCLLFSLALLFNHNKQDRSISFASYCSAPLAWSFDAEAIIRKALPKQLCQNIPSIVPRHGRLRGMTATITQDDQYRLDLAAWREGGGRLFSVQHGANYGNLHGIGGIVFEYCQHAFITWGWDKHAGYPCNAVPLPQPALCNAAATANEHREWCNALRKTEASISKTTQPNAATLSSSKVTVAPDATAGTASPLSAEPKQVDEHPGPSLILVGTEMSTFSYRLKTRPMAAGLIEYRKEKVRFFQALPKPIAQQALYRPYLFSPSALDDAPYVQRHIPFVGLCKGDNLMEQLAESRLAVLDHYGTTLHLLLAANIPVLCFWSRTAWTMEARSTCVVGELHKAGIFFDTAAEAAAKVAEIWDTLDDWWQSSPVQQARQLWVDQYALASPAAGKSLVAQWVHTLRGV